MKLHDLPDVLADDAADFSPRLADVRLGRQVEREGLPLLGGDEEVQCFTIATFGAEELIFHEVAANRKGGVFLSIDRSIVGVKPRIPYGKPSKRALLTNI